MIGLKETDYVVNQASQLPGIYTPFINRWPSIKRSGAQSQNYLQYEMGESCRVHVRAAIPVDDAGLQN